MAEIADLGHVHVRELAASDWEGLNSWIRMLTCSAGLPPPALIHNVLVTLPELLWKEKTLHRFTRMLTCSAGLPPPALIHKVSVTLAELLWKEKTLHRFIRMLTFPARSPRPRP